MGDFWLREGIEKLFFVKQKNLVDFLLTRKRYI